LLDHLSLDEYNENAIITLSNTTRSSSPDGLALKKSSLHAAASRFTHQLPLSAATTQKSKILKTPPTDVDSSKHNASARQRPTSKLSSPFSAVNFDQNNNSSCLSNFNYFDTPGTTINKPSTSPANLTACCSCKSTTDNEHTASNSALSTLHEDTATFIDRSASNSSATDIVLDVYLLAECCFNELVAKNGGDNLIDLGEQGCCIHRTVDETGVVSLPYSAELLERWNISMITNKR
jgi:hypothetical protein